MDLEERSIEQVGERCEECGAKLTPQELEAVMESGGPALCSIHAAEDEPGLAADEAGILRARVDLRSRSHPRRYRPRYPRQPPGARAAAHAIAAAWERLDTPSCR